MLRTGSLRFRIAPSEVAGKMHEVASQAYIPIEVDLLQTATVLDFDLFIKPGGGAAVLLYLPAGERFDESIQARLIEWGARVLYVRFRDSERLEEYFERNLDTLIQDPSLGPEQKSKVIYSASMRQIEKAFQNPHAKQIQASKETLRHTVDYIVGADRSRTQQLLRVMQHDLYTCQHSVNVGMLGVILAREVQGRSDLDLYAIGYGMFLHDIGKTRVAPAILNKPGRLNDWEWEIMKTHPQQGYDLLSDQGHLTPEAQFITLQHHERCNGKGYPEGIHGGEIHLLAKICNIVDSYDALLAKRPYKNPLTPFQTLTIMKEEMVGQHDFVLFERFVGLLHRS